MKVSILIIEDDEELGNQLKAFLALNGFGVERVWNGIEAREAIKKKPYDILLVDVMMPDEDGFTLIRKLREEGVDSPFLFLTARGFKEDILHGLKLGAEDYIVKPFDPDELVLRLQNILRRINPPSLPALEHIQIGKFHYDIENLQLVSVISQKTLTVKEGELLTYLHQHQKELIKRKDILGHLWEEPDFFSGRSLDVFITRLRKLLAEDPAIKIESVRGIGFRFFC